MITLTTPIQVPGVPGSGVTNAYNKIRLRNIVADPVNQTINASVEILSSSNAALPPIDGTLSITTTGNSPSVSLSIPQLEIYEPSLALNTTQETAIQGWITTLQNAVEGGMVANSLIAGTQSTGV